MESASGPLIFIVIGASIGLFCFALLGMLDLFKRRKKKTIDFY